MERLTKKNNGVWEVKFRTADGMFVFTQQVIDRLAAYEDTGLEPGAIKSLVAEFKVNLAALDSYRKAKKIKTNADKYFRNATDEEIAKWIHRHDCHTNLYGYDNEEAMLDWLKQEVADEN